MISYKKLVNDFLDQANTHIMVNTTGFGPGEQIDTNRDILYPYVWLEPQPSTGISFSTDTLGTRTQSFNLYVLDLPDASDELFLDVFSKTEQITYDLLTSYFQRLMNDEQISVSITNMEPIEGDFLDRVAGWLVGVDITTPVRNINYCNAPFV